MRCFDLLGDGIITKIDLKRVLDEFHMDILTMDLESFISRCGLKKTRNQISYLDLLEKFWNRSESGLVQRIVISNRHFFLSDGYHGYSEQIDPEQLEAKLVEFLHKDYYIMRQHLRSADIYKLGVVTNHEFREAVLRVLRRSLNDKQWKSMLESVGLDSDGLIPYVKFLEQFNQRPGQWRKDHRGTGGSPPPPVERLQAIAIANSKKMETELKKLRSDASQMISIELKKKVADNIDRISQEKHGRGINDLLRDVKDLIKSRFTSIEKAFNKLDTTNTGCLNKAQFGEILNQCDMQLLPRELDKLWASLNTTDDSFITFNSLIYHYRDLIRVRLDQPQILDTTAETPGGGINTSDVCTTPRSHRSMEKANRLSEIMDKIRPKVHEHWKHLKEILQHADKQGQGHILGVDMKEIFVVLKLPLTESEMNRLLSAYDKSRNGHFHYMVFLKHYAEDFDAQTGRPLDENFTSQIKSILLTKDPREETMSVDILRRLRTELHKSPLLKEHHNIQRAFKKADGDSDGFLSVSELKAVLKLCDLKVNMEDLYNIMTEFDVNMNGKISYQEFLSQIMF